MDFQTILVLATLFAALLAVIAVAFNLKSKVAFLETKYSRIIDIDSVVEKLRKEKQEIDKKIDSLRKDYKEKRIIFEKLVKEAAIYDEEIQLAELGFYKPHFDFDTSERYKEEIALVKEEQKDMISLKNAIYCNVEWAVNNSTVKGRTMTNRGIKLTARAFNNECDSAISNTRWNNIDRMEKRIEKAFNSINKLNESKSIVISDEYYQLKLKELRLAHEYANKKRQEKEEQQEITRQMREEAKLEREMERALEEEEKYGRLLERAKKDADKATGSKLESLNKKILELSQQLEDAHEKSERAKSMAEQTKRGHVYVISNIGSFGEGVYKIGMTRRLEPLDRVKELGDASVPFTFDIHAIIYSEDAPALESLLHRKFDQARLNLVNNRKEFFRVNLSDIKTEVGKIAPNAEFIETAEARDFRESRSIASQHETIKTTENVISEFPDEI